MGNLLQCRDGWLDLSALFVIDVKGPLPMMTPKKSLKEKRFQLNAILKKHDVQGMKDFISENPREFEELTENQKQDDLYLFDLLHLYKAHLFYLGTQYFESMNYCLRKGIIKLDPLLENQFRELEKNQENQSCVIMPEWAQEKRH